jgi:hypothetical protein
MILDILRQLAILYYSNKTSKPIAMIRLQVTCQPFSNIVIRAAKNSLIPANFIDQVRLRLNYANKTDLLFMSELLKISDEVILITQTTLSYLN